MNENNIKLVLSNIIKIYNKDTNEILYNKNNNNINFIKYKHKNSNTDAIYKLKVNDMIINNVNINRIQYIACKIIVFQFALISSLLL